MEVCSYCPLINLNWVDKCKVSSSYPPEAKTVSCDMQISVYPGRQFLVSLEVGGNI